MDCPDRRNDNITRPDRLTSPKRINPIIPLPRQNGPSILTMGMNMRCDRLTWIQIPGHNYRSTRFSDYSSQRFAITRLKYISTGKDTGGIHETMRRE